MSATILIVEDHAPLRRALRDWLEGVFPQHQILEAADGEEAVAAAQAELPQLVVMDIGLPKLNGIEATRQIVSSVPGIQIVILSVHNDEAYRSAAADQYCGDG